MAARAPRVFPGMGMVSAEEEILGALSQLLETAKAIERTIGPFVEDGLRFTPRRSERVEAMFHHFDGARDAYYRALREADRFTEDQTTE